MVRRRERHAGVKKAFREKESSGDRRLKRRRYKDGDGDKGAFARLIAQL